MKIDFRCYFLFLIVEETPTTRQTAFANDDAYDSLHSTPKKSSIDLSALCTNDLFIFFSNNRNKCGEAKQEKLKSKQSKMNDVEQQREVSSHICAHVLSLSKQMISSKPTFLILILIGWTIGQTRDLRRRSDTSWRKAEQWITRTAGGMRCRWYAKISHRFTAWWRQHWVGGFGFAQR